jgi:hypothetical protein
MEFMNTKLIASTHDDGDGDRNIEYSKNKEAVFLLTVRSTLRFKCLEEHFR